MSEFRAEGAFTAVVTPFRPDGSVIDWAGFERHVEHQLQAGIVGIVPCGTTGESPTLAQAEQVKLIETAVAVTRGRGEVLAGTGSHNTQKTVAQAQAAVAAGADAVMVVVPYYSRPSQDGLKAHFAAVANAVSAPIVIYNVPGRTVASLFEDTLLELIDAHPNIVGLKDATGNVLYCQNLLSRVSREFAVLSGDDALTLPMMSVGASGVISVTSNVYPKQLSELVERALAGEWSAARNQHFRLLEAHRLMFFAPSPVPAKAALAWKGYMSPSVRLPLTGLDHEARSFLEESLARIEDSWSVTGSEVGR